MCVFVLSSEKCYTYADIPNFILNAATYRVTEVIPPKKHADRFRLKAMSMPEVANACKLATVSTLIKGGRAWCAPHEMSFVAME